MGTCDLLTPTYPPSAPSLIWRGGPPVKGESTLQHIGRRELRGDPKRLVREAGGDSPYGGSARR
jgi:hypothetical protein